MLIIGEEEAADGSVSVRKHGQGETGRLKVEEFAALVKKETEEILNKAKSN